MLDFIRAKFPQDGIELETAAIPNPFFGHANNTFVDSGEHILRLIDGGLGGEVVPLQPLLVKARNVDTIIAIDSVSVLYLFAVVLVVETIL